MFCYHLFMFILILNKISTTNQESNDFIDDYYDNNDQFNLNKNNLTQAVNKQETQILDQTRANLFKDWLDSKSHHLYEMSRNYSAYHLINATYNTKLRDEVNFAVINFTSMIIDISMRLSQVLQKKSQFVEKLSDSVEKTYENFKNNSRQVRKSIESIYHDSKSPKTFCDIFDTYKKAHGNKYNLNLTDLTNLRYKRSSSKKCLTYCSIPSKRSSVNRKPIKTLSKMTTIPTTTPSTTTTTTTTANTTINDEYQESNNEYDDDDDDEEDEDEDEDSFHEHFWDIECLNRTNEENFQKVQKVNTNQSTIQVPTNIFKQELSINMTAYWSQALDIQFKENYENDQQQLYWQYFCSSNGLFRQYPGSHWTVPRKEDFFDCRLQSWYMMAAASAKDILFLLDVSGSMTGLRLEIGKKLIEFLLDTFSDNDFFNIILYSDSARFLFENVDANYSNKFIQANKANKNKFRNELRLFKDTNQQAKLKEPLELAFNLFDNSSLTRNGCNKMLMIITDGNEDNVDELLAKHPNVRIFSFKIGRDMNDLIEIKKLACSNKGEFYHVMTLTDINEHVYEYITVLSRPMALMGVHETKWSNVFIGHLDKVLKIAVARPAFKYNYSYFEEMRINQGINSNISSSISKSVSFAASNFFSRFLKDNNENDNDNDPKKQLNQNRTILQFKRARQLLKNQQVLLGVVGIDVDVLKLVSSVSPKYQMGVGIYIIMLDNNGYIVYHPSIKKEIATSASDYKGTSNSVDMDIFEIPIHNEEKFEQLEHDMIDKYTGNVTLANWKREGIRVIKRRTEYVYTPVLNTPFSVALASPLSFGSYYIDIAKEKEQCFDENIKRIKQSSHLFDSLIQLYNCSYKLNLLVDKLVGIYTNKTNPDYCIRYLLKDSDQILAIKLDLKIHETIYNSFNYTMYSEYRNLVKSTFYGTYSGLTFYLPVTFFNNSTQEFHNMSLNLFSTETNKLTYSFEKSYYTRSIEFSDFLRTEYKLYEPIVIYFLNHTGNKETVSASLPVWLDKIPVAVAGSIYDTHLFKNLIFTDNNCDTNLTCYLIDEHGIVILTNSNDTNEEINVMGMPLYKVNPWLMLQLELDGVYDLIIPGSSLQDCNVIPLKSFNSASNLISFLKSVTWLIYNVYVYIGHLSSIIISLIPIMTQADPEPMFTIPGAFDKFTRKIEIGWKFQNSHCSYFGIYSFNLTKWNNLNSSSLNIWCSSDDNLIKRQYLAGYLQHSNLLMLVVENQKDFIKCGKIEMLIKNRSKKSFYDHNEKKNNYSINRYRSKVYDEENKCYDCFANESEIFKCVNSVRTSFAAAADSFVYLLLIEFKYLFLFCYSIFLVMLF